MRSHSHSGPLGSISTLPPTRSISWIATCWRYFGKPTQKATPKATSTAVPTPIHNELGRGIESRRGWEMGSIADMPPEYRTRGRK